MLYFSQILGIPVVDVQGKKIGVVNDLGIATKEVFPRITSLAFQGPEKTPFMISWRKYVESCDEDEIRLKVASPEIRFSYLQPNEVLIARDLLNKQIVDTRGMRVVRVNDLKLSDSGISQLRLLGAEVGMRGLLRSLNPMLERIVVRVSRLFNHELSEKIIAWSYMDLLDRGLTDVKLSVSHKRLMDMHPADIADIIEQLDPRLRAEVFAQLDDTRAADAIAELDDDEMGAEIIEEMSDADATRLLSQMDPDDAAELVSELDYERAEQLLRLMGVKEGHAVRKLLGYREHTAGRIMTGEFLHLPATATIQDAVEAVRKAQEQDFEMLNYIYVTDEDKHIQGVLTLKTVVIEPLNAKLQDIMIEDLITCSPDDDQEDVAETISKYNLLALPVVDDAGRMLGIVTVDDALDVMEEEHEEDLQLAGAHDNDTKTSGHTVAWFLRDQLWFFFWALSCVLLYAVFYVVSAVNGLWEVGGITAIVGVPFALLAADSMVSYVCGFALENDEDDEDAPSVSTFFWRGVGIAGISLVLMLLVASAVCTMLFPQAGISLLLPLGFIAAALTGFISFLCAPLYLLVVRKRDREGRDTRRLTLRLVALFLATLLYIALVLVASLWMF